MAKKRLKYNEKVFGELKSLLALQHGLDFVKNTPDIVLCESYRGNNITGDLKKELITNWNNITNNLNLEELNSLVIKGINSKELIEIVSLQNKLRKLHKKIDSLVKATNTFCSHNVELDMQNKQLKPGVKVRFVCADPVKGPYEPAVKQGTVKEVLLRKNTENLEKNLIIDCDGEEYLTSNHVTQIIDEMKIEGNLKTRCPNEKGILITGFMPLWRKS